MTIIWKSRTEGYFVDKKPTDTFFVDKKPIENPTKEEKDDGKFDVEKDEKNKTAGTKSY